MIGLHVNKLHRPEVVCLHPSGMTCAENELSEKAGHESRYAGLSGY
ncbi:Uncharacterised protein [Mycobacteroides abscessus subsp. bolletii]|nr:Uncharacterised protein [Mycobacteroides abscessus subsp. bolletii]